MPGDITGRHPIGGPMEIWQDGEIREPWVDHIVVERIRGDDYRVEYYGPGNEYIGDDSVDGDSIRRVLRDDSGGGPPADFDFGGGL